MCAVFFCRDDLGKGVMKKSVPDAVWTTIYLIEF